MAEGGDDVTEEERTFAEKLRQLCTRDGEERLETLEDSADVLFELGKLYLGKATTESCSRMQQKLSFIKSAALLIGAKVRYEMKEKGKKVQAMQESLKKFSSSLFEAARRSNICDNVFEISATLKEHLQQMRKEMKDEIGKLSQVSDDAEGEELVKQENLKIQEIQCMMKKLTENYIKLMRDIAKTCLEFLGDTPCKFAMVGLGSLAREEITLYSDFEHVIILEDVVLNRPDYEKILEYFRWFAVLFQVIVIGFGETFIRSVGVKSINDLYSEDSSKNWFYDAFTPCGVAFDGMVPHSCNNPLGRQVATKNRPHKVELIQTASKMANFLCSDENVKNGYFLKDVLTRTCFVYGDETSYDCFKKASMKILASERLLDLAKEYIDKMLHNPNHAIQASNKSCFHQQMQDYKNVLYRPVTTFLSYLGRLFNISDSSSFNVVDRLHATSVQDTAVIDADAVRQLKFAVAIACEVRVKTYALTANQRHALKPGDVVKFVGMKSAISSRKTLHYLTRASKKVILSTRPMTDSAGRKTMVTCSFQEAFNERHPLEEADALLTFGYENEALELVESSLGSVKEREASVCQFAAMIYIAKACREPSRAAAYWKKVIELQERALNVKDRAPDEVLDSYECLADSYFEQKDYKNALEMAEQWLTLSEPVRAFMPDEGQVCRMEHIKVTSEVKLMPRESKVGELLPRLDTEKSGSTSKHAIMFGLAEAYIDLGRLDEARNQLELLIQDIHDNARYSKFLIRDYGHKVVDLQMGHDWFEDALVTIDSIREILFHGVKAVIDFSKFDSHFQDAESVCFYKLGRHDECSRALETMIASFGDIDIEAFAQRVMAHNEAIENARKASGNSERNQEA